MRRKTTWNNYYKNRKPNISNILLHWQYLAKIIWNRPKRILEVGCGPAEHSLFVKKLLPSMNLSLLDLDRKLVTSVIQKNPGFVNKYFVADITSSKSLSKLHIGKYDLVMSQGLMEHFPSKKFIQVINNIRKITKDYIFSVPSNEYPTIDYGNEILRSSKEISKLMSTIPKIKYTVSPYIDIGFRTKFIALKAKKMTLLSFVRYLLIGSSHLLVEVKYLSK